MSKALKHLLSPLFVLCLALLLVNDFMLKTIFHNAITGKISDFCGLFIFPIFWSAIFPRHKKWVFIFTGLIFIYWKSDYATPFIAWLSPILIIHRTVDSSDLLALSILVFAWINMKTPSYLIHKYSFSHRLIALFIGVTSVFSFCATSQQRYIQQFEQPQYVLLQSDLKVENQSGSQYEFYNKGDLLIVKIQQLYISKPPIVDDFNKNQAIHDLDKTVAADLGDSAKLIPVGQINTVSIATPEGRDELRFNGGRLDGRFRRFENGRVIMQGFYKMGLEDSVWTNKNSTDGLVTVQTFVHGERTSIKQFDKKKLLSQKHINTRTDTIRVKYFQIILLIMLASALIIMIVRNYRMKYPQVLQLGLVWKLMLCVTIPIVAWLMHAMIRILFSDLNQDIFAMIASIIIVFIITCPILFLIIFWIKLRKEIDIFLYSLLFAFLMSLWSTYHTLSVLL